MENNFFQIKQWPDYSQSWYFAGHHTTYCPSATCTLHVSNLEHFLNALWKLTNTTDTDQLFSGMEQFRAGDKLEYIDFEYYGDVFFDVNKNPSPALNSGLINIRVKAHYKNNGHYQHPENRFIAERCAQFLQNVWDSIAVKVEA